jgi:hypothetical protein
MLESGLWRIRLGVRVSNPIVQALSKWVFRPAQLKGQPVAVKGAVGDSAVKCVFGTDERTAIGRTWGRIAQTWELIGDSFAILKSDKELMLLPISPAFSASWFLWWYLAEAACFCPIGISERRWRISQ